MYIQCWSFKRNLHFASGPTFYKRYNSWVATLQNIALNFGPFRNYSLLKTATLNERVLSSHTITLVRMFFPLFPDLHYKFTSNYFVSDLHELYEDVRRGEVNHMEVAGPFFGFGTAVGFQSNHSQVRSPSWFLNNNNI